MTKKLTIILITILLLIAIPAQAQYWALWRLAGSTIYTSIPNLNVDLGSGDLTTTGAIITDSISSGYFYGNPTANTINLGNNDMYIDVSDTGRGLDFGGALAATAVTISAADVGDYATLDISQVVDGKTFAFPNIAGTLVTTSGALADINIGAYALTTTDTISTANLLVNGDINMLAEGNKILFPDTSIGFSTGKIYQGDAGGADGYYLYIENDELGSVEKIILKTSFVETTGALSVSGTLSAGATTLTGLLEVASAGNDYFAVTNMTEGDILKVDSAGNITFNNAYKFPVVDGSDGEVLTTDGSGNIAWEATGAGGGEWTDTGSILHPNEETVDEIVIGGTTEAGADIFLGVDGAAVFNQQSGSTGDFKIESDDNDPMFFVDYSENCIAINQGTCLDELSITGGIDLIHTAIINDEHALELDVDAAGYGDIKALDINYTTGAISAGEDEGIILININEIAATGGDIFGVEVLSTEGSAVVFGLKVGAGVGAVHQDSGIFINASTGTNNTFSTNVPNMIDGDSSSTTTIFVGNGDYIIIGADTAFEEIEFIIRVGASGAGIKPTFGYSVSGSHQFATFSPVDGTNGFRNTGIIAWDDSDLISHVANDSTSTYDILITRTIGGLSTPPELEYAKTAATTEYIWDNSGNITINSILFEGTTIDGFETTLTPTDPTADRTVTFRDATGTVIISGDTFTGDVTATLDTDGGTVLSIGSAVIVEADLNADEAPADNDILTFDTTGANFSWQTPTELGLLYSGGTLTDTQICVADGTNGAIDCNVANTVHAAVTITGQDYLTLSTQQITMGEIEPDDLAISDFGFFSCDGSVCGIDADAIIDADIDDDGNFTFTGTWDFSGGDIVLPTLSVDAGTYAAGSIDGDDMNANFAGRSLTEASGSPDVLNADTELYTHIATLVLESPVVGDDAIIQHKFPSAVTITRISASTDTGIVYFQLDERAEATPNTAGTDVLSSSLAADSNSEASASFANAGIAADVPLSLDVDTVSGSPTVLRIHIDYNFDD